MQQHHSVHCALQATVRLHAVRAGLWAPAQAAGDRWQRAAQHDAAGQHCASHVCRPRCCPPTSRAQKYQLLALQAAALCLCQGKSSYCVLGPAGQQQRSIPLQLLLLLVLLPVRRPGCLSVGQAACPSLHCHSPKAPDTSFSTDMRCLVHCRAVGGQVNATAAAAV